MTQIFRVDNPLFGRGLTFQQRLCYLSAMLYYQFALPGGVCHCPAGLPAV